MTMQRTSSLKDAAWRQATRRTIARLRQALSLDPDLTPETKRQYLDTAARVMGPMPRAEDVPKFWSAYANTVRILVASSTDKAPDDVFENCED